MTLTKIVKDVKRTKRNKKYIEENKIKVNSKVCFKDGAIKFLLHHDLVKGEIFLVKEITKRFQVILYDLEGYELGTFAPSYLELIVEEPRCPACGEYLKGRFVKVCRTCDKSVHNECLDYHSCE